MAADNERHTIKYVEKTALIIIFDKLSQLNLTTRTEFDLTVGKHEERQ